MVAGNSLGNWGAAWWQWALNIPEATNPLLDPTGEFCDQAQGGTVWFLAGNFGGQTERTCTIPSDRNVFFPILNDLACVDASDPNFDSLDKIRASFDAAFGTATVSATLDGTALKDPQSYRARSDVFTLTLSDGNLLGLPAGQMPDCLADGYAMILKPLSRGAHTLHFAGNAPNGFSLDVVYHLNISP